MPDFTRPDEMDLPAPDSRLGVPGGLAAIFLDQRSTLLRFLTRRLGSQSEAEDALQEVWIKLSERPPSSPIADPLAYLFRMSENAARDLRRSESRRHSREGHWVEQRVADGGSDPSPEDVAVQREHLRAVAARLARLPERTRQIFLAFRVNGRPQKQLAADHGISLSAVQKHLQRAYRAVLELADDEESEKSGNDDAGMGPS